jgi:DNA-directed DNA polymerase III PolC
MSIPQLRVRTEYSFRTAYGPLPRVAERLRELGTAAAGIVDRSGTWGHAAWEQSGIESPMYGTEFVIPDAETGLKPACWALAEDLARFYRLSSRAPETAGAFAETNLGAIVFAGAALTDPATFDYIDINPRSRRRTRAALALAKRTRKPLVLTSDADYPAPEDRLRFLAWDDSKKLTPQHLLTDAEFEREFSYLGKTAYKKAIKNTREAAEWASGLTLRRAPMIWVEGDIRALVEVGRKMRVRRGHIPEWTPAYAERLERELLLIEEKEYSSYFMVVADMIIWAKKRMLVGPARGSSAGSLVCYLMEITEVDPLVHGLIFERFIDVNRDDLPDIDIDFSDVHRHLVFDYVAEKYGAERVARIGSVSRLKPRSVIAHVGKKLAIPHGAAFGVTNVLVEHSSGDARYGQGLAETLETTKPGRDFIREFPEAELMGELELHASHSGQHAGGVIISTEPVTEYCTVRDGIAHIDKKDAEYLNLLKVDALGLRTLGIIEDSGCITSEQLYDLRLDDPKVFAILNDHKFSGVFQFEGAAQRVVSKQVVVDSFIQIDHITALSRPGPLGGGASDSYIKRAAGSEATEYVHPALEPLLSSTFGVMLYQEQVMQTSRDIGGFSWADITTIRRAMSKSYGEEFFAKFGEQFVTGAERIGMPPEEAQTIWDNICSFGAYGMNKSHTVSYAMISYWCAYMKVYFPTEYAAACLRNAKDDVQSIEILRELVAEGVPYEAFDAELSNENWTAAEGKLLGGYVNLVGVGKIKAANFVARRNGDGLTTKDKTFLAKCRVKHADLRPAHTLWGAYYDDPDRANVAGRISEFGDLEDKQSAVVICCLVKQDRRDKNETVLVNRRGYAEEGQTLFLDSFMADDSVAQPIRVRIGVREWNRWGEKMADRAVPGEDWFIVRGKWSAMYSMMFVKKIKCLTNEEMFE